MFRKNLKLIIYMINFIILVMFQACSREYDIHVKDFDLSASSDSSLPSTLGPSCHDNLCKTSLINPEVDVIRPPTKILFVVDNSRTMQLSQKYLSEGIQTLAKDLHGFDADFYIYSTSDSHQMIQDTSGILVDKDDKPILSSTPLSSCTWSEIINGVSVSKSGADCPNDQKTTYVKEFLNILNSNLVSNLNFRSSNTDAQLLTASKDLESAISSVGIDGSSTETGICSLVRSVYNENVNSIFKKGDNVAMVIMSDENDSSTPLNCLSRITQEESFTGRSAQTQSCNPAIEKCDSVDYQVSFQPVATNVPYAEVRADYSCNNLSTSSCGLGAGCSAVKYSFTDLHSKIRSSCLSKVDYIVTFAAFNTYSRKIDYNCLSSVPYKISFNPLSTYSQSMSYQCEQIQDGVSTGTYPLSIVALNNTTSSCVANSEIACDATAIQSASSKCSAVANSRLIQQSCKLKCVVGSQPVASVIFNDTDVNAQSRDLRIQPFINNSVSYSNLYDLMAKSYPQYILTAGSIIKGSGSVLPVASSTGTDSTGQCSSSATGVDCDASQVQAAANSCGSLGRTILQGSCKSTCLISSATSSVIYSDNRNDADQYNLENGVPFVDSTDLNKNYSNLTQWGLIKYGKVVSSVLRVTPSSSPETQQFINESCASANSVESDCLAGSLDMNAAQLACGPKHVTLCKKRCVSEARAFQLFNVPNEDSVDFCGANSSNLVKFATSTGGVPQYSSIQQYVSSVFFAGQGVTIPTCTRMGYGYGYTPVVQTPLLTATNKPNCDGSYGSIFDLTTKCKASNQSGITPGSLVYSCIDRTKSVIDKPALVKNFTYAPMDKENICDTPFVADTVQYSSLKSYMAIKNGRSDTPVSCVITGGRKTVIPSGLVSSSKVTRQWTFPKTMLAESTDANLEKAFLTKSTELFGEGGFFVSAIIRDQKEDSSQSNCRPLDADQSLGVKYRSLVESAGSLSGSIKGDITSICATDYSKSLRSVSSWVKENVRRTIYLNNIVSGNVIVSISLVNQITNEEKLLIVGEDYEVIENKVNFINPKIDLKGWLVKYVYM